MLSEEEDSFNNQNSSILSSIEYRQLYHSRSRYKPTKQVKKRRHSVDDIIVIKQSALAGEIPQGLPIAARRIKSYEEQHQKQIVSVVAQEEEKKEAIHHTPVLEMVSENANADLREQPEIVWVEEAKYQPALPGAANDGARGGNGENEREEELNSL